MTGLRPDSTKVWDLWTDFRDKIPDVVTLPQYLKHNGYHSVAIGKIYHNIFPDTLSWSEPKLYLKQFPFDPDAYYVTNKNLAIQQTKIDDIIARGNKESAKDEFGHYYLKASATESPEVHDTAYYDGAQTVTALNKLEELAKKEKPFFFGVGYYRPHLPFNAPKKYWDLYNRDSISLASNPFIPNNAPPFSVNTLKEIKGYSDFKDTPSPSEGSINKKNARLLKHGYYASVSYVDAQVGKLIEKLKKLGIYDNTIIVLWGDHGYKLGEHNGWTKFTNYNIDTHVPFIIKSNDARHNHKTINQFVEMVDVFPTLCDLTGLEIPENIHGMSALPIMNDNSKKGKEAVFAQFLKESYWAVPEGNEQMGYSILTDDFHYIAWQDWKSKDWGVTELYDLNKDPNENVNVAENQSYASIVHMLDKRLHAGWSVERTRTLREWSR